MRKIELGTGLTLEIIPYHRDVIYELQNLTSRISACRMKLNQSLLERKKILNNWLFENANDQEIYNGKPQIYNQNEEGQNYTRFNMFPKQIWSYRIEQKFVQKIQQLQEAGSLHVMAIMGFILDGYFNSSNTSIIDANDLQQFQVFFKYDIPGGKAIVFCTQVEKIPRTNSYGVKLLGFDYIHVIRFIDIIGSKDMNNIQKQIQKYQSLMLKDPAKADLGVLGDKVPFHSGNIQNVNIKKSHSNQQLFFTEQSDLSGVEYTTCIFGNMDRNRNRNARDNNLIPRYFPQKFQPRYLSKNEIDSYIFSKDIYRWVPRDYRAALERQQFYQFQAQMNRELLNKYADFTSAAKLVELLQKIPNFRVKLTQEEQDVVGANGNLLIIGRSGTGKTTCAILRLFAMEVLFKLRVSLYKQKHGMVLQDTRYSADDIDSQVGLHCIFVTASPVLTTEVQRYYNKLNDQVKAELEKKQQKLKQQQLLQKQKQDQAADFIEFDEGEKEDAIIQREVGEMVLEPQNDNSESEEEEETEDQKIQNKMEQFVSLAEITEKEFPAFLTIKKLILMIDAAMTHPFFSRSQNAATVGRECKANWSNENQGVLLIEDYRRKVNFDDDNDDQDIEKTIQQYNDDDDDDIDYENEEEIENEYQRQLYFQKFKQEKKYQNKTQKNTQQKNIFAREVDFDFFDTHFWPRVNRTYGISDRVNSTLVWTEIFSYIKGSAQSHEFPGQYLSKRVYLAQDSRMLTQVQRERVYEIYIQYERWKIQNNHYDQMDVVNYLLTQFKYGRYFGAPVHYLMVDEVQDLPHATLLLLSKITEQGLFFAGDTAQNIAKGVGFRFCDLKSLFQQRHFGSLAVIPPTVKQLTVNFRSHNQILEVANSLVSLLEIFFPKTIDRLKKERSDLVGPKPLVLEGSDIDMLFFILSGQEKYKQNDARAPLEFGCNQVVIVKDQESKNHLPSMLQHALCLTIYEAKGLEFDDVVLYNFFSDSNIQENQWNLLNQIDICDEWVESEDFYRNVTRHNKKEDQKIVQQNWDDTSSGSDSDDEIVLIKEEQTEKKTNEEQEANIFGYQEKNGKILTRKMVTKVSFAGLNIIEFSSLCTELKQLYVAVTRPRNRLIIFDQDRSKCGRLIQIWKQLQLIDTLSSEQLQEVLNSSNTNISYQEVAMKTTQEEWLKQGKRMFRNRFYEQAMKCYQQACDQKLEMRAKAYFFAEKASKVQAELEASKTEYESTKINMVVSQKAKFINKHKELSIYIKKTFSEAAELFLLDGRRDLSAQCLYSAEKYKEALILFNEEGLWKQAGEAAYLCGEWETAAKYFDQAGDYIRTIDCYEKMQNWELILATLHKYKETIALQTREAFLKRFLPLALSDLLMVVDNEKKIIQVIEEEEEQQEEDEDELLDEDQDQLKEEDDNNDYNQEDSEQELIEEQQNQQQIQEITFTQSEASILEKSNVQKSQSQAEEISFSESQASILQGQKEESQQQMITFSEEASQSLVSHLSHVDLDDEFLKNDKQSIIKSIQGSEVSQDFSAVSYAEMAQNPQMQIINTKVNIYVQDEVMQKIIKYISMFSDEFKYSLHQQRSKNIQLSQEIQGKQEQFVDFILDLDLVDIEFVYLILDTLEQFKQYKLCIFVCNRYKLSNRVGRYLASIGSRYSILSQQPATVNLSLLNDKSQQRKTKLEEGCIAKASLHCVLENINPTYLSNSALGVGSIQQLCNLGYWKACLYALDQQNQLELTENMSDYVNFKFIELTNRNASDKLNNVFNNQKIWETIPFKKAETPQDFKYLKICLDDYLNHFFIQVNSQGIIHYKILLNYIQESNDKWDLKNKQSLPQYFEKTQCLVNFILGFESSQSILNLIKSIIDEIRSFIKGLPTGIPRLLKPGENLSLYESIKLLIILFEIAHHNNIMKETLSLLCDHIFLDLVVLFDEIITQFNNDIKYFLQILDFIRSNHLSQEIIESCLVAFLIKNIKAVPLQMIGGGYLLIQRKSIIVNDIMNLDERESKCFFIDLDLDYLIAPREQVFKIIQKRLIQSLSSVIRCKIETVQDIPVSYTLIQFRNKITQTTEKTKKQKTIDFQNKLSKTDPLRQFLQYEKKREKELLYEKYQMELEALEFEHESTRTDYQPIKEVKKKIQGELLTLEALIEKFNKYLLQTQTRAPKKSLHPLVFVSLLETGLGYLKQVPANINNPKKVHKLFIRGSLILNYLGELQHSLSLIRRIQKTDTQNKKLLNPYRKFIEFLETKNLNITPDQSELLFQFISIKITVMKPIEFVSYLENITVQALIAQKTLKNKIDKLLLPKLYEEQTNLFKNAQIVPIEDDGIILEIIYWIEYALNDFQLVINILPRLLLLVQVILINTNSITPQFYDQVMNFFDKLNNYDYIQLLYRNKPWSQVFKAQDSKALIQAKKSLLDKNNQFVLQLIEGDHLELVEIQNTIKSIDAQYDQSFQDWMKLEAKNFRYIINVKKVQRYLQENENKIFKLKYQSKKSMPSGILDDLHPETQQVGKGILYFNHQLVDLVEIIQNLRKEITIVLYSSFLDNALDFHYISVLLHKLYEQQSTYCNQIREYLNGSCKDIYKIFVALKNEIESTKEQFLTWKAINVKFDASVDKLLEKNRKILAIKWMNQKGGFASKFQKIQKKRTGLKKQQALQNKKESLKLKR